MDLDALNDPEFFTHLRLYLALRWQRFRKALRAAVQAYRTTMGS